jgi:hypothetical protein
MCENFNLEKEQQVVQHFQFTLIMSRPVRHPGGMFSGASNFGVYDGMFTEVHGNYYNHNVNFSGQPQDAGEWSSPNI